MTDAQAAEVRNQRLCMLERKVFIELKTIGRSGNRGLRLTMRFCKPCVEERCPFLGVPPQ